MENFIFQNPVKLIMGRGMIARLAKEIPSDKRIMITFGGGSVKKNGVYDQVKEALKNHYTVEFWGIEPNPAIETLRKAIALGKEEKVDYLLAVGGGSVIDGTKLISAGLLYDGDAWDLVLAGRPATHTVPLSTVLTLPATGSEMNNGAVISRRETKEKYPFYSNYPLFSILDPEVTFTLPPHQVACGLADTFVHVMEQYMTTPRQSRVMDRWAEGLLQTLIEIAPRIRENQHDYQLMADFMLIKPDTHSGSENETFREPHGLFRSPLPPRQKQRFEILLPVPSVDFAAPAAFPAVHPHSGNALLSPFPYTRG